MKIKSEYTLEFIKTNGVTLHTLIAGNKENPLIILLHGFPEFMKGWENQVDDLVEANYFVVVPDQRGYNLSDKPWSIKDFTAKELANDIIGLIDHFGKDKAFVAGHDWGAAVAWFIGMHFSDRLLGLITFNVPHSLVMSKFLKHDKEQKKKSQYMAQFQVPLLPQLVLSFRNYRLLWKMVSESALPGTFTVEDELEYKKAWKNRRALTSMINWYRAAFRKSSGITNVQVSAKNLIVWGVNDKFLKKEMGEQSLKYCENGRIEYINDATHWVLHEKPEVVNPIIINFLKELN